MSNIMMLGSTGSNLPKDLINNYKYLNKINLTNNQLICGDGDYAFVIYKNYFINLNDNRRSGTQSSYYYNLDDETSGSFLSIKNSSYDTWSIIAHGQIGENYYVIGSFDDDSARQEYLRVYRITPTLSTTTITTNLPLSAVEGGDSVIAQSHLNNVLFFTGVDGINYYSTNGTTWYTSANIPNFYYKNKYIRCEYSWTTNSFTLNFYTNTSPIGTNNLEFNELIGSITINSYHRTNYGLHAIGDKLYFNYNGKTYLVGDDLSSYSEATYLTSADQIRPNGITSQSNTEWQGLPNSWSIKGDTTFAGVKFNDENYYTQYLVLTNIPGYSSLTGVGLGIYQNKYLYAIWKESSSYYSFYKYEMINPY